MNAIQQLLTDHIDIWTAADTAKKSGRGRSSNNAASVYGIKKLRELILELAVRGKLVPQDPNDEPAGELLKRIQVEKAKLIAEGKIKRKSPLTPLLQRGGSTPTAATLNSNSPHLVKGNNFETPTTPPFVKGGPGGISVEGQPFELPQGWEWARLGNLYSFEYGDNLPAGKRSSTGEYPVYGSNGIVGSHNICFVNSPCIVIGRKGSAGAINLSLEKGCCVTDVAYYCIPPKNLDLVFSFKLFHTLGLDALGKGIKPGLNRNEAYKLQIAIPPLAEQHRIVAKVDELMVLCDQLETQHNNAAEAHEKLVSHLLGTLTQSPNTVSPLCKRGAGGDLDWQRIAAHFDTLFTTEASIDAIKQTLLQLAVMGKLVPQDPNDEPASELLKHIQAEKAKLVAQGKIKKDKLLPPMTDEEKLFDLPQNWKWVRFGEISTIQSELVRPEDFQDARQVAPDCIEKGTGRLTEFRTVKESGIRGPNSRFYKGQIVYSKIRPSLSKAVLVDFDGLCSADMYPINVFIESKFMLKQILSECFLEQVRVAENRIKMPKLNQESLTAFVLPLPPLSEQHRIVAKVDELMAICDQLKSRITVANQLQQKLADVVVEQAIS